MDIRVQSVLELASEALSASCATWHPTLSTLLIALGNRIIVCDAITSAVETELRVAENERIQHLLHTNAKNYLVAITTSGYLYAWDGNTYALAKKMLLSDAGRHSCAAVSSVHPYIFYASDRSTNLFQIDLTGEIENRRLNARKTVSCIVCHDTKPLMASATTEGQIRVWDYQIQSFRVTDEYTNIASREGLELNSRGVTCLAFHPRQDYLFAGSENGLVVCFKIEGQTLTQVAGRVVHPPDERGDAGELVALRYHPLHNFFLTLLSGGGLRAWEFVQVRDQWHIRPSAQMARVLAQQKDAQCYEERTPAYVPLVSPVSRLSDLVLHPRLNLLTLCAHKEPVRKGKAKMRPFPPMLQPVYMLVPGPDPMPAYAVCTQVSVHRNFFAGPSDSLVYDRDFLYVKRDEKGSRVTFQLVQYSLWCGQSWIRRRLPERLDSSTLLQPVRLMHGPGASVLLFMQRQVSTVGTDSAFTYESGYYLFDDLMATVDADSVEASTSGDASPASLRAPETHVGTKRLRALLSALPEWQPALDAVWVGVHGEHLVLAESGNSISLRDTGGRLLRQSPSWDAPVARMWSCPTADGLGLCFYDAVRSRFLLSVDAAASFCDMSSGAPSKGHPPRLSSSPAMASIRSMRSRAHSPSQAALKAHDIAGYMPTERFGLSLEAGECVSQVAWQRYQHFSSMEKSGKGGGAGGGGGADGGMDEPMFLAALVTTRRILIVSESLRVLTSYRRPEHAAVVGYFGSVLWTGGALMFTTSSPSLVQVLTLAGRVHTLCSLPHQNAQLTAVLSDRVYYVCPGTNGTEVYQRSVGLLQTLLLGELDGVNPNSAHSLAAGGTIDAATTASSPTAASDSLLSTPSALLDPTSPFARTGSQTELATSNTTTLGRLSNHVGSSGARGGGSGGGGGGGGGGDTGSDSLVRNNVLRKRFELLVSRHDASRVSADLLLALQAKGWSDLAWQLLRPVHGDVVRYAVGMHALKLSDVVQSLTRERATILKKLSAGLPEPVTTLPAQHVLTFRLRHVLAVSLRYGQWAAVEQACWALSDWHALLSLYTLQASGPGLMALYKATSASTAEAEVRVSKVAAAQAKARFGMTCEPQAEADAAETEDGKADADGKAGASGQGSTASPSSDPWPTLLTDWPLCGARDWDVHPHVRGTLLGQGPVYGRSTEEIGAVGPLGSLGKWLSLRMESLTDPTVDSAVDFSAAALFSGDELGAGGDNDGVGKLSGPVLKLPERKRTQRRRAHTIVTSSTLALRRAWLERPGTSIADLLRASTHRVVERLCSRTGGARANAGTSSPSQGAETSPAAAAKEGKGKQDAASEDHDSVSPPSKALPSPREEAQASPNNDAALQRMASAHLKGGLQMLESNQFYDALDNVNKAIKCLLSVTDVPQKRREIGICVNYKLVLKLLVLIARLKKKKEGHAGEVAQFTCILTTVPMQAKHRVVCAKHAVSENLKAANYGIVLQLVEMLAIKSPAYRDQLSAQIRQCQEAGGKNACAWAVDLDLKTLKFCYKSLRRLEDGPCLQCNFCDALFASTSLSVDDLCPYCGYGRVESRPNLPK